jgi:hypothetical protein
VIVSERRRETYACAGRPARGSGGLKLMLLMLPLLPLGLEAKVIDNFGTTLGVSSSYADYAWIPANERVGFTAGIFADWGDGFLRTSAEYTQRGFYIDAHRDTGATMDYLSISVNVKLMASSTRVQPFLTTGPRLDLLLGHANLGGLIPTYMDSGFRPVNLGWDIGAGVKIPLGYVALMPEVSYRIDIGDEYAYFGNWSSVAFRTRSIQVGVGLGFLR